MNVKRIIDVTFFDDTILEIGEEVMVYSRQRATVNEYGEIVDEWEGKKIWGSLQPEESSREDFEKGSKVSQLWNFYCGSQYRLYIDDLIKTNDGDILQIYSYTPWDSFGVREFKCRSIDVSQVRDFGEFNRFEEGIEVK